MWREFEGKDQYMETLHSNAIVIKPQEDCFTQVHPDMGTTLQYGGSSDITDSKPNYHGSKDTGAGYRLAVGVPTI
jgi:hypothetical protein